MVSLNLLDKTAPLARDRKAGMSRRFIISTLGIFGVLFVSALSLEAIFSLFGLGEGTVFFKPDLSTLQVSKDEFAIINREKATAHELFFDRLQEITPSGAKYTLIKLSNSSQILVQGWINSEADATWMFDQMRGLDQWNLIYNQVFPKENSRDKKQKFMYKADFITEVDTALDFISADDLPPIDSLQSVISKITSLADKLNIEFIRKPTISKTVEGSTLHEYVYTMNFTSQYTAYGKFLETIYIQKMPIIFDKIDFRPSASGVDVKSTFRILLQ